MNWKEPETKNTNAHRKAASRPLRVLVVEDNQDVAANIGDYLEERDHIVDYALDGVTGLHLAVTQPIDVVVLDIMLPGMDGLALCRRFREEADRSTPILMLTAKDTLDDKLKGFEAGADDYLLKPFALEELEARLQVLARRSDPDTLSVMERGNIRLDLEQRRVTREGKPVKLNRTCFRILVELMRSAHGHGPFGRRIMCASVGLDSGKIPGKPHPQPGIPIGPNGSIPLPGRRCR